MSKRLIRTKQLPCQLQ